MRAVVMSVAIIAFANHAIAGSIRGHVEDRESRRQLPAVNVIVAGLSSGTTTDANGDFVLSALPAGICSVRASRVGYQAQTLVVTLTGDDTARVAFSLLPLVIVAQPVMVTATRGRERETPATFATLGHTALRERYTVQDVPVLLSELPSTTWYSESGTGLGYTYLNIRGFDARRIAVMINGIPQNDPEDHNVYWLDAPDLAASVDDIQVQRGAGSAFYGSPAIGGSVNLTTDQFARDRSVAFTAGVGSYDTRKYSASYFSGLIDGRYAVHARLSRVLSGGYRERAWVDCSSYFLGIIRYDSTMSTQFNFYGGPVADGLAYYGIAKSLVSDRDHRRDNPIRRPEEIENFSQPHVELMHEWRLSHAVTLSTTLFLVLGDGSFDYDGSWAPLSYYRITPSFGFPVAGDPDTLFLPGALIRAQVSNTQWGWLPRLTVQYDRGEVIVGGEVRVHRSVHWGRLQWAEQIPAGVPSDHRYYQYRGAKDMASVYVHVLQDLSPRVKAMGSLQYAFNRYRLYDERYRGTDFSVPYHFVNPRFGVNCNISDQWNIYGSLGYTSREPRLKNLYDAAEASTPASWGAVLPQFATDAGGNPDFSSPLVKPESLLDLELGGGYGSGEARLAANVYWMEFTDEIVKSGQIDRFGQPITGNAGRTRHIGLEVSGTVSLARVVEVSANASLSRNRFVRHRDYSTGVPVVLDGSPIAGFPDFLANMRMTCRVDHFTGSLAARYVGKQYTDNFKNPEHTVDPYVVSDLSVSYRFERLFGDVSIEAKVQVNNLFDALYAAYGEGIQFFVGAERNAFVNVTVNL